MKEGNKQSGTSGQEDALKKVNLDDYAGDAEDNKIATERADRYMEDLERAKDQNAIKPDQEQPE